MGIPAPKLPPTRAQYHAALAEGRNLYREDLEEIAAETRHIVIATVVMLIVALLFVVVMGGLFLLRRYGMEY